MESADNLKWKIEPVAISVPDENAESGSLTIGCLAVGKEQTPEGEMNPVVFIGADKTWTTLTVSREDEVESVAVAKADLVRIGEEIIKFAEKL